MRGTAMMLMTLTLLVVPLSASAAPGDLHLASVSADGVKGTWSIQPSVSGDGSRVAFMTDSRLHPDDDDDHVDVYVKDVGSGALTLASRAANGDKANSRSHSPSISADGRRVAFVSGASNLHPSGSVGLFVKDLDSGAVFHASPAAEYPFLSADGSRVAFQTTVPGLDPRDTDDTYDVYVSEVATGALTLVSTSADGVKANGDFFHGSGGASLSADGRLVAFGSGATNLHPDDRDDVADVFVKDLASGELTLVSTSAEGTKGSANSVQPSLSADGSVIAFRSYASNLVPDFSGGFGQIFVKDLTTGAIQAASRSGSGVRANRGAADPQLSADGTRIAFSSGSTNLHPADTDPVSDVFAKDLTTGAVELASASSGGAKGNHTSYQVSLAADGSAVAFRSDSSNLHPDDPDSAPDSYVKELGGPDPSPEGTADLSIRQTDSPDPVPASQPVTYDIEVINHGPATATGVTVSDELPDGVTLSSATVSQGDGCVVQSERLVRCQLGTIAAGDSAGASVAVVPNSTRTLTNTVTVQGNEPDTNGLNNRSAIHTKVDQGADVAVSNIDAPDRAAVRSEFTYTVTVANHGPTWASLELVATLPPELTATAATVDGAVSTRCSIQRREVQCSIFGIPDGDTASARIIVSARKPGTFTTQVAAQPHHFDPDPSNNGAAATTTVTR